MFLNDFRFFSRSLLRDVAEAAAAAAAPAAPPPAADAPPPASAPATPPAVDLKAKGAQQPPPPQGFFAPDGTETPPAKPADPNAAQRPEWLLEKYKTPEDQAKAYSELHKQFVKKTDDLRAEVRGEVMSEYGKSIGVPEDAAEYEYPDNVVPPEGDLDQGLRDWAKKHNVSPEGFKELIGDVYAKTLADHEAEKAALGENADQRASTVSNWAAKNIDKALHPEVLRVMTTAKGVEFMEQMMKLSGSSGFAPDGGGEGGVPLTREAIREAQADPRFGTNEAYTASVRAMWSKFAATQK